MKEPQGRQTLGVPWGRRSQLLSNCYAGLAGSQGADRGGAGPRADVLPGRCPYPLLHPCPVCKVGSEPTPRCFVEGEGQLHYGCNWSPLLVPVVMKLGRGF